MQHECDKCKHLDDTMQIYARENAQLREELDSFAKMYALQSEEIESLKQQLSATHDEWRPTGKWEIDNSAGRPILVYEKCSVIEAEQAQYILNLIANENSKTEPSEFGLPIEQEPKYTINGTHIINRATGEPIPHDEPIFIFRAKDRLALSKLENYWYQLDSMSEHSQAVGARIAKFYAFMHDHPERMKTPDTAPQSPTSGEQS